MIPVPAGVRVWLAGGTTDMRCGMNSLALKVQEGLRRDPHGGDLFIFRGRCEAAQPRPLHMALASRRGGLDLGLATRLPARRYRLAQSPVHLAAAHGGVTAAL